MKLWQKFEIWGAAAVLLSLFLQFFVAATIEENMKESDAADLEMRLEHIYSLIKNNQELNPPWDEISKFNKGPRIEGDNHWQFQEVYYFVQPVAIFLFIVGAILALIGKYIEYTSNNA